MHTIDLLNGAGAVHRRTTLSGLGLAIVVGLVPCLLAAGALYQYWHNRTILMTLERVVVADQPKASDLADPVVSHAALAKDRNRLAEKLGEVASRVEHYNQWSPVLVALAKNMPDGMFLTTLAAERANIPKAVPSDEYPEKTQVVSIPSRTLVLTVGGPTDRNCDAAVKEFTNQLEQSTFLGPKLEDIVVSQEAGRLNGAPIVLYKMKCVFRTNL
ncbi:MAG: hypothetical protein JSU70_02860 [Phycisphaerales bacterium]|nr:MAG: hypothetical protein JSU70_02860 [Phycisphaerales bacterium]